MSIERLREQNEDQREKIRCLEIALLNAESILQTLTHHGKGFDEIHEVINTLSARLVSLEEELRNHKMLITRALQQTYGNGPTA